MLSRDINSQSTQGGNLVQVFDEKKSKMANVMLEIFDGVSLEWGLMHQHSKSTFLQVTINFELY